MAIVTFNRKTGMRLEIVSEGYLDADGTEQIVVDDGIGPAILSGFISTDKLQAGDTIIVRAYVLVNGTYARYGQETYSGAQPDPAVRINGIRYKDKLKITLQQTTGTHRSFDFEFVREV